MTRQDAFVALERVKRRTVKAIAASHGPPAVALYTLAAGGRRDWTLPEWVELLARLDADTSLVEDYIALA